MISLLLLFLLWIHFGYSFVQKTVSNSNPSLFLQKRSLTSCNVRINKLLQRQKHTSLGVGESANDVIVNHGCFQVKETEEDTQAKKFNGNIDVKLENNEEESTPMNTMFQKEVMQFLIDHNITWQQVSIREAKILAIGPHPPTETNYADHGNNENDTSNEDQNQKFKLGLHIIPTPTSVQNCVEPDLCKKITDRNYAMQTSMHISSSTSTAYASTTIPITNKISQPSKTPLFTSIIHLHEDVWENKQDIVTARILAKLNHLQNRWYARNTVVKRIPVQIAMDFLQQHHLWGSTRAKFNYGLFQKRATEKQNEEEMEYLLAVATFSPRRHVQRKHKKTSSHHSYKYRSHELIRYCAKKDEVVIGGITKLLAKFCRDLAPDDIITCIDRDFGDGEGWGSIGFEKVQLMPPLVMAVGSETNVMNQNRTQLIRKYLVGAGIGSPSADDNDKKQNCGSGHHHHNTRPGIDAATYADLNNAKNSTQAIKTLIHHGLFPVFDTGVERRMLIVQRSKLRNHVLSKREELGLPEILISDETNVIDIWNDSSPSFPDHYYSQNNGIELLLQASAKTDI